MRVFFQLRNEEREGRWETTCLDDQQVTMEGNAVGLRRNTPSSVLTAVLIIWDFKDLII